MLQVILEYIAAIVAIYGAVMSTINQIQIRRQMQRRLSVSMRQEISQLPRIPNDQGGFNPTQVHVFIIHVVNSGLIPVTLKETGLLGPAGKSLTQKFHSDRRNKQFPLELAPGDDLEVSMDAYHILEVLKGNQFSGTVTVRGYIGTPLKQYAGKKVRFDMESLSNDVTLTEGAWRKGK